MVDPYGRRSPYGRGAQPPKSLNEPHYAQQNTYQANQPGYGYQQGPEYQQPNQSSYQQPNQSNYQQPSQSAYQPPSHSSYQQPSSSGYQNYAGYPAQPQMGGGQPPPQGSGYGAQNDYMSDFAAGVLRSQGETYFHRGQAYVQSRLGFISAGDLHYLFDIDGAYVWDKLLLLLLPFFGSRSFARKGEQISGGHRYQPPRKDVFAPDLYIPSMALCTYVVLLGVVRFHNDKFTPENMYLMGSSAVTGWAVQWLIIKTILYLLGVPSSMPVLEILAYAGYPFFFACLGVLASLLGGVWPYRVLLTYGTIAMGTFMIRVVKHVLFQDRGHGGGAAKHNYILLALGALQLPFLLWFHA